jgi:hypothetical protein
MDIIEKKLTTFARNQQYHPAIRTAVSLGKKTLNRYYSLTDSSEVYRIAMVLHPRHKLAYFKNANWESEWIDTAEALICEEFTRSYSMMDDDDAIIEITDESIKGNKSGNIFDNMTALAPPRADQLRSEIDCYLSVDIEQTDDAVRWWHERRAIYPKLSCMAIDYLTIPATSVDVERVFSHGRLLLSHVRSRLSVQSTRALLCLGNWSMLNLIKSDDVKKIRSLPDIEGEDKALEDGWDRITVDDAGDS